MALQDTDKEMRFSVDNGVGGESFSSHVPHPPCPCIVDDNVPYNPATYHDVMRVSMQVVAESVARVKSDNLLDSDIQELSGNTAILSSNLTELSGVVSKLKPGGIIDIDDSLSPTSKNPVENRVITTRIYGIETNVSTISGMVSGVGSVISSLSSTVISLGNRVGSAEATVSTISASVSSLNSRVGTVESSISGYDERIDSVEESVETLSGDVNDLSDDVSSALEEIEAISGSVESLSANAKETDNALYCLIVDSTSSVDGRIIEISGNLVDLSGNVSVISENVNSNSVKIATLSSDMSEIGGHVDLLDTLITGVSCTVDELSSDISELSGNVFDISEVVYSNSGKISTLSSDISLVTGRVDLLDLGLASVSGTVDGLDHDVVEISGNVTLLSSDMSEIGRHVNLLDLGLSDISGIVGTLSEDVSELSGSVLEVSGSIQEASGQIYVLSEGLSYTNDRVDEISGNLSSVGGGVAELSDWCDAQFVNDEFTSFMDIPFAAEIRGGYSDDDILLIGTKKDGIHYMFPGDEVPSRCECPGGQTEFDSYQFRNITKGNGCYIATNRDAVDRTNVYVSTDGKTWSKKEHTIKHSDTNGNICYSQKYDRYFHVTRASEYPELSSTHPELSSTGFCVETTNDLENWGIMTLSSGDPVVSAHDFRSVMCADDLLYVTTIGGGNSTSAWYTVIDLSTNTIKKEGNDIFHGYETTNGWMRWQDGNKVYWGLSQSGVPYSDRILMTSDGFETYEEYLVNPGNKLGLDFPTTYKTLIIRSLARFHDMYFIGTYETASPHILMSYDMKNWHVVSTPPFGIGSDMLCPFQDILYVGYSGDDADVGLLAAVTYSYHTDHLVIHGILQDKEGGGSGGSLKDVEQITVPYNDKIVRAKVNEIIVALGGTIERIPDEFTDEDIKDKVNEIILKYS